MELSGVTRACGLRLEHDSVTCLAWPLDGRCWVRLHLGDLPDALARLYAFGAKLAGILAAAAPAFVLRSVDRSGGGGRPRVLAAYMRAHTRRGAPDFVMEVDGWCVRASAARGAAVITRPAVGGTRVKAAWPPALGDGGQAAAAAARGGAWDERSLLALAAERMRAVDAALAARGGVAPGEPTLVVDEEWAPRTGGDV